MKKGVGERVGGAITIAAGCEEERGKVTGEVSC